MSDVQIGYVVSPPLGWLLVIRAGGQPLGDVPLDSVHVAPEDGYQIELSVRTIGEEIQAGMTYVLRTQDGRYAVIRIIDFALFGNFVFDYKYQDDGTRNLDEPIPVQPTTWSSIKNLYQSE